MELKARTQVIIIGAGPAGLLLSHLLHLRGIESVVIEQRSRDEVETTVRAGVLEQGTVTLLTEVGLGDRLSREGAVHHGITLRFNGGSYRIPLSDLTGGRAITLYAQHEVLKDLIAARIKARGELWFESHVGALEHDEARVAVHYEQLGTHRQLIGDFVVGCDGFHGITRQAIPVAARRELQIVYPFGWFGVLLEAPLLSPELIYARHARGFALVSTRSASLQRLYFQCDPQERPQQWQDAAILAELQRRLETTEGWTLKEGRIIQKDVVAMRSFVCETMRHGRILLAGDAAHIVPPTGAKGMNLAVNDVSLLAEALHAFYRDGSERELQKYPERALARVWRAQRFSWWMTSMLHRFNDEQHFQHRMQLAELERVVGSVAAQAALAEDYVG